jgi:hypothetical protein
MKTPSTGSSQQQLSTSTITSTKVTPSAANTNMTTSAAAATQKVLEAQYAGMMSDDEDDGAHWELVDGVYEFAES